MTSKYTPELKARAIELVLHAQGDPDTGQVLGSGVPPFR